MHLVGPDIGAVHRLGTAYQGHIDIAEIGKPARSRRIGAQRLFRRVEIRPLGRRAPHDLQALGRLDSVFLAGRDHADEIAEGDDADQTVDVRNRCFVDRDQAVSDMIAVIEPRIRRANDAAMQHARHAHIMHISPAPRGLLGDIDARPRRADQSIVRGLGFKGGVFIDRQSDMAA